MAGANARVVGLWGAGALCVWLVLYDAGPDRVLLDGDIVLGRMMMMMDSMVYGA